MGVSACIIARDEADMLEDCLVSLAGAVDQICLVDTGSTDATLAIAAAHGAKVQSIAWQHDFSHARNVSLALAEQPWILVIDADERLDPASREALQRASAAHQEQLAFLVAREDLRADGPPERVALPRLFRNHPQIRFSRPVHESIMESLLELSSRPLEDSGVRIVHLGYLPEVLRQRDKHARNLAILHRRFEQAPDDLYNAYKLAVTLPAHALSEKLSVFAKAQSLMDQLSAAERAQRPFLARLCDAHAAWLATAGSLTRASGIAERAAALWPDSPDLRYRRGELARRCGDLELAVRLIELALAGSRQVSEVRADRPHELAAQAWVSLLAIARDGGPAHSAALPPDLAADVAVRCAEIRLALARGGKSSASAALAPLLESHFQRDEVKLVAGELAWALRDFATAHAMWSMTHPDSDAGHAARGWLRLLAVARNQTPDMAAPLRDVADAALALLIGRLSGVRVELDPALRKQALGAWRARWCEALRHAGRADLAQRGR